MNFYVIRPLPFGEIGSRTKFDTSQAGRRIASLHYVLDELPDQDLINTAFVEDKIVSRALAAALHDAGLTGFATLSDLLVELSPQLQQLSPERLAESGRIGARELLWLRITGSSPDADLRIYHNRFVVSEPALAVLRQFRVDKAEIAGMREFEFDREKRAAEVFERAQRRLRERGLARDSEKEGRVT